MSVKHSIRIFFFIIALVYTGSLTAQEKAYPKNGEGITLFLKRFNRTGGTYQKEFIELNKGKLGKNNTLRMGVKYTLPPLASTRLRTMDSPSPCPPVFRLRDVSRRT